MAEEMPPSRAMLDALTFALAMTYSRLSAYDREVIELLLRDREDYYATSPNVDPAYHRAMAYVRRRMTIAATATANAEQDLSKPRPLPNANAAEPEIEP